MTVRVYRSTDGSAPVLNGTAGSFSALLYACLVTGYGSQSASGWAREFTATNKSVFRAATGNRFRLRVDDTGTQEARMVGYEVMTDVDTGTSPFPTSGQVTGGLFVRKSNTADATSRPWVLIATGTAFYFLPHSLSSDWLATLTNDYQYLSGQCFFGDVLSFKSGDTFNSMIIGAEVTGASAGRLGLCIGQSSASQSSIGHYMPRQYYQSGGAIQVGLYQAMSYYGPGIIGSAGGVYPDPISGAMHLSPMYIIENGPSNVGYVRGVLPGLWGPCHALPGSHGDQISGSGESSGKTFLMANVSSSTSLGRGAFEISDTW